VRKSALFLCYYGRYGWNLVGDGVLFVLHPNMVLRDPNLYSTVVISLFTFVSGERNHVAPYYPFYCPRSAPK